MPDLTRPSELMALLEIQFDECNGTLVRGSIAADQRHHQPSGIVHGGLSKLVARGQVRLQNIEVK